MAVIEVNHPTEALTNEAPGLELVPGQLEAYYPLLTNPQDTQVFQIIGKVAGGNSPVYGTLEGPVDEALASERPPVVIFPGLLGVQCEYAGLRSDLARHGQWALTIKPFRGEGRIPTLNLLNAVRPIRLASRAMLGLIRETTDITGQETVEVLAHSNGTTSAVDLALHKKLPLVESIVSVAGVGLDGHRAHQMIGRLRDFGINDFWPSMGRRIDREFVKEEAALIIGNILLTLTETAVAAGCDLEDQLVQLIERGVKIGGILFTLDDFINLEGAKAHSGHLFNVLHIYRDPAARHTAPQDFPDQTAAAYNLVRNEMHGSKLNQAA